jgi:hypothetical protein
LDKRDDRSLLQAAAATPVAAASPDAEPPAAVEATCSCLSGIPVLTLSVGDQRPTMIAVPLIFERLHQQGRQPGADGMALELLQLVRIYNAIPDAEVPAYQAALEREYADFCRRKEG